MTTMTEQLDEMLGMAREVGALRAEHTQREHELEMLAARSPRRRALRSWLTTLSRDLVAAELALERARNRFLKQHGGAQ